MLFQYIYSILFPRQFNSVTLFVVCSFCFSLILFLFLNRFFFSVYFKFFLFQCCSVLDFKSVSFSLFRFCLIFPSSTVNFLPSTFHKKCLMSSMTALLKSSVVFSFRFFVFLNLRLTCRFSWGGPLSVAHLRSLFPALFFSNGYSNFLYTYEIFLKFWLSITCCFWCSLFALLFYFWEPLHTTQHVFVGLLFCNLFHCNLCNKVHFDCKVWCGCVLQIFVLCPLSQLAALWPWPFEVTAKPPKRLNSQNN